MGTLQDRARHGVDSADGILERIRHLDFHDWLVWCNDSVGRCCLLEVDGLLDRFETM